MNVALDERSRVDLPWNSICQWNQWGEASKCGQWQIHSTDICRSLKCVYPTGYMRRGCLADCDRSRWEPWRSIQIYAASTGTSNNLCGTRGFLLWEGYLSMRSPKCSIQSPAFAIVPPHSSRSATFSLIPRPSHPSVCRLQSSDKRWGEKAWVRG